MKLEKLKFGFKNAVGRVQETERVEVTYFEREDPQIFHGVCSRTILGWE